MTAPAFGTPAFGTFVEIHAALVIQDVQGGLIFAAGHPTHDHQVAARKPFGIGVAVFVGKEEVAETVPETLAITLTPVLKRLAASSLVTRACDDADERLMRTALTSSGRNLRTKLADVPDCVEEATGLTKTEIREL